MTKIPIIYLFPIIEQFSVLRATVDEEMFFNLTTRTLELAGYTAEEYDKALMEYVDENWTHKPN